MAELPDNSTGAIKARLLKEARAKTVKEVVQYDVFLNAAEDLEPDKDGDALWYGGVHELRNTDTVRVQFPAGASAVDVLRALKKIVENIEKYDEDADAKEQVELVELLEIDFRMRFS